MRARSCALVLLALTACRGRLPPPPAEGEGEGEGEPLPLECAEPTNRPAAAGAGGVYFGSRTPTLVPLDEAQQLAVVAIGDRAYGAWCSGTLIADDVVLTAQHCTEGASAAQVDVLFGPDDVDAELAVAAADIEEHPDGLDIAMIRLAARPADTIAVRPIPITRASPPLTDDDTGVRLEQAGYGETHDGTHGRYFVTERFDGAEGDYEYVVDGEGSRGVCFGDSGGPSLHLSAEGDARVLGVLSWGDPACMFRDRYQRADVVRAWIEAYTGATPAAVPEACDGGAVPVTEAGSCGLEQASAVFCEGGVVVRDLCGPEEICGDDGGAARCIAVSANPCGAVSAFGACDDQTLTWCDAGTVKTRACDLCVERCLLLDPAQGFSCVPTDCGELTYEGACDGAVAQWCDVMGQKHTQDCAELGQPCQYLGPESGYWCFDAEACQGYDYRGQCDGTVLTWCEDGEVFSQDCADDDQVCGLVDEATGYDCQ